MTLLQRIYRFARAIVLLWAAVLILFQMGVIEDLQYRENFWADAAQSYSRRAIELDYKLRTSCRITREQ